MLAIITVMIIMIMRPLLTICSRLVFLLLFILVILEAWPDSGGDDVVV